MIGKRDGLKTLNGKLEGGLVGQVVQMQGVRETLQNVLVARWVKPITADRGCDIALRGDVQYVAVQSKDDDAWRKMNTLHPKEVCEVTLDTLIENLSNKVKGWDGHENEGKVQSRPMVSMTDTNDTIEYCYLYTSFDAAKGNLRTGIDAFKNINMTKYNHRVMACVAGRVDIPLAELKGYDALDAEQQAAAEAIHEMAAEGELKIAINPGASMNLLPYRRDEVLASEEPDFDAGPLTKRGFFEADFSLRTYASEDEVVSSGPMLPLAHNDFVFPDNDDITYLPFDIPAQERDDYSPS